MDLNYQLDHKIRTAKEFEAQGKLLHAVQIYTSIIEDFPEFIDAYFNLADLYENLGNIQPAVKILKELLDLDPEDNEVRLFLGQFYLRNMLWDETIEILSYMLPEEEPVVLFFLGYSYFMLEDYELAKINFLNFIDYEAESELIHEANLYIAKIEIKLENYESALQSAKKAEGIYSNFWELNIIYAEIYYQLGMYAHAVPSAEKAMKLNPGEPSIFELAGKIYLKHGDYLKAEKYFRLYIELVENASAENYTKLAEACLKVNKPKDALAYFDIALKLDPLNKFAIEGKKNASSVIK